MSGLGSKARVLDGAEAHTSSKEDSDAPSCPLCDSVACPPLGAAPEGCFISCSARALAACAVLTRSLFRQVWCNGEEVKVVSGTKDEYVVDVWSGNHPVFQGGDQSLIIEAGQLNKFDDKWGDMGEFAGDLKTINDK